MLLKDNYAEQASARPTFHRLQKWTAALLLTGACAVGSAQQYQGHGVGTGTGAAIGAGSGAAIGAIAGGGKGALVGGAAGAGVGAIAGHQHQQNMKHRYYRRQAARRHYNH